VLFDIGSARRDFGYEPAFDVAAALQDMARRSTVASDGAG
jgi:hypothetical protein